MARPYRRLVGSTADLLDTAAKPLMNPHPEEDLSNFSMLELFRAEAETQTGILNGGLLELERGAGSPEAFDVLMRAAHSLKGAARIVNLQAAVRVAHAFEDCFVAAQRGRLVLRQVHLDVLFQGVDLLSRLPKGSDASMLLWETEQASEISGFLEALANVLAVGNSKCSMCLLCPSNPNRALKFARAPLRQLTHSRQRPSHSMPPTVDLAWPLSTMPAPCPITLPPFSSTTGSTGISVRQSESPERVVRLTAENLNRLLGLAGESLVDSRWLGPFAQSLQRLKRHHMELEQQLERLRQVLGAEGLEERTNAYFVELFRQLTDAKQFLSDRSQELDLFDRRSAQLSQRLYLEVLRTRMRPFSDGVRRFPRMVRDLARSLGKEIRFDVSGENTQVDRDILERLETPLAHLLRNAVDHGCESSRDAGPLANPRREHCAWKPGTAPGCCW